MQRFDILAKSIEDSSVALRQLMSDLRLQALELGFQLAIERVIEAHREKMGGEVTLDNQIEDEPQPALAAAMYRNIREALANVSKHAPGADVAITLEATSSQYIVVIADRGPGFVVADARSPEGHIGLSSMREQIEALGGSIVLESEPGDGATVRFTLPIHVEHSIEADTTFGGGSVGAAETEAPPPPVPSAAPEPQAAAGVSSELTSI
jgi:signal transduction histidine kinase